MNGYMGRAIDLSGNATATLSFWYMIPSIEDCLHIFGRCDYFSVQIDGQEIYFDENPSLSWMPVTINLRPYGMTNHFVWFQFVSNGSFKHEGAYLDNILVIGQKTLRSSTCTRYTVRCGLFDDFGEPYRPRPSTFPLF